MEEIIKVVKGDLGNVVNARELHQFLGIKTRFNDWIKRNIADFDFIEEQDYISRTQKRVGGGVFATFIA